MSQTSIIINADDFGFSDKVSDVINACFEKCYIDRTTIMVNMPAFEYAVALAEKNNYKNRVGLHLNLTVGMPLTEGIKNFQCFCDPQTGEFNGTFKDGILNKFFIPLHSYPSVAKEIEAQILKYEQAGFTLKHLDSHHHIHKIWPVLMLVIKEMKKHKWYSIRIAYNNGSLGFGKLYNTIANGIIRCRSLNHSDALFESLGEYHTEKVARKKIEIETHPRYDDGEYYDKEEKMSCSLLLFRERGIANG